MQYIRSTLTKKGYCPTHKLSTASAALTFAGLAAILPTSTAHADTAAADCADNRHAATSGDFYAYDSANCDGHLGNTPSWDSGWGNSSGPFTGGDTNKASSILHKGTSGLAVAVHNGTGQEWGGGYACLRKGELHASNLSNDSHTNGVSANNSISSHRWVAESSRGKFVT